MTDLTFKVGTTDFSQYVDKGEYFTDLIPVTISRTDLNGVNHTIVIRHRGFLRVKMIPMSPSTASSFFTLLASAPVSVKYHSFQTNTDVTQTMIPSFDNVQDAAKRSSGHWTRSFTVSFTQE